MPTPTDVMSSATPTGTSRRKKYAPSAPSSRPGAATSSVFGDVDVLSADPRRGSAGRAIVCGGCIVVAIDHALDTRAEERRVTGRLEIERQHAEPHRGAGVSVREPDIRAERVRR